MPQDTLRSPRSCQKSPRNWTRNCAEITEPETKTKLCSESSPNSAAGVCSEAEARTTPPESQDLEAGPEIADPIRTRKPAKSVSKSKPKFEEKSEVCQSELTFSRNFLPEIHFHHNYQKPPRSENRRDNRTKVRKVCKSSVEKVLMKSLVQIKNTFQSGFDASQSPTLKANSQYSIIRLRALRIRSFRKFLKVSKSFQIKIPISFIPPIEISDRGLPAQTKISDRGIRIPKQNFRPGYLRMHSKILTGVFVDL